MEKALFSAQIDRLPEILEWMRKRLQQKGLNPKAIRRLELALEEAIVNVIRHSYQGKEGKIELALEVDSEEVTVSLKDWGPPFDPLKGAPPVDSRSCLEEREEGGLGIYLMRKSVDKVVYIRENEANLLRLTKKML